MQEYKLSCNQFSVFSDCSSWQRWFVAGIFVQLFLFRHIPNIRIGNCYKAIELYDLAGKQLSCIKFMITNNYKASINTACLPNGYYTCKVVTADNNIYYGKLIKQ